VVKRAVPDVPELMWDGKYGPDGKKVAPLRVSLPFQTIETVNESVQERQHAFDFMAADAPPEWRNRLIWGDKKYVLPALVQEFAGTVELGEDAYHHDDRRRPEFAITPTPRL